MHNTSIRQNRLNCQDFLKAMKDRILVFDGAMGTQLQSRLLSADDFGGLDFEGCNENLVLTRPDIIEDIHRNYLAAGADIIETNTFGATALVLDEYGLKEKSWEINFKAAQIAKRACRDFSDDTPRFVAGSMGPTTKAISITGGVTFDVLVSNYAEQAQGLLEGGADILLLETGQDTLNIKAGLQGIWQAFEVLGLSKSDVPVMVSGTIEPMGTMLAGQSAESLYTSLEHAGLMTIGLNCATGPDAMRDHIRSLAHLSPLAISCMPNAGLPDEEGKYHESPEMLAAKLAGFCEKGLLNIVGGCCGTTPQHIRALKEMALLHRPRPLIQQATPAVCGIDYLDLQDTHPIIVGERTNVIGSKLFKELIVAEQFEEAAEVGRKQVRNGAHIVDICLANPDRDEKADMVAFLKYATKTIRAPFMIDSTDAEVLEEALKRIQGKSIINSINLEDGEERFGKVCPLIKKYGAAVVVGCIDEDPEQGMAVSIERKLAIAKRSHQILTTKYGIPARDIIFDPLVFPCGTGDKQYIGSARKTIEGIRAIKQNLPECFTILGISNVSFGLPPQGREVLNTVFLHQNFQAGLDMAIVNSEKLQRITQIPETEIRLCENLIDATLETFDDALSQFVAHFRSKSKSVATTCDRKNVPVERRLALSIIEGSKSGLIEDLEEMRQSLDPLDIINGPLMEGMKKVGELFGNNQLIVAEVLQSAEVMKAAVTHLQAYMEKSDSAQKGKMLLATVKGDVHDIGKNLVDIILSNNGFQVINLGIKVLPQTLIDAFKKHQPDLIGLSGLLVKSAQEMVITAEALKEAGIHAPLFVGGAALSEKFTYSKIAAKYDGLVCYARDAMTGLSLANQATDPKAQEQFKDFINDRKQKLQAITLSPTITSGENIESTQLIIHHESPKPAPPDIQLHAFNTLSLEEIWPYMNPSMLYTRHLGLKGRLEDLLAQEDSKALSLHAAVREMQEEILTKRLFNCRAIYQFMRTVSHGNFLILLDENGKECARFDFPRQKGKENRCLSDLVASEASNIRDFVGIFVTTCQGTQAPIRELADDFKNRGEYLKSHILHALAIETAEATAEWLHQKMRAMWGIADAPDVRMRDLFSARYQGRRYSFGYPACPNLEDQAILWNLLKPQEHIGVELTDGFMMDPESSVSALVFHHSQASYFSTLIGD